LVFFLKTMVKKKDNLAAKVKEQQALRVPGRPFPPDSGPGENARRNYRQRNRGYDWRESQHYQGACEKLAEHHYLIQAGTGRGARYTIK
jgi:hypothetical protein